MSLLERLQKMNNSSNRKENTPPIATLTKEKKDKKERKKTPPPPPRDPYSRLKASIHRKLIEEVEKLEANSLQEDITRLASELLDQEVTFLPKGEREKILQQIVAEAIGYGPIHPLLQDDEISEIMVNGPDQVYIERNGKLEKTDTVFRDDAHVLHIIEKIVAPLGRRIDESMPMVDARLPDGSRVNAIIPPPFPLRAPVLPSENLPETLLPWKT